MKNRIIFIVVCIIALILGLTTDANNIITFIVKPFSIYGEALRKLSLLGGVNNFFAILLFVVVSLIPFMILLRLIIIKRAKVLDYIFLSVITVFTFLSIYGYINPTILLVRFDTYHLFNSSTAGYDILLFILNAFYVYILYLLIGIYLVLKMHHSKEMNIVKVFRNFIKVVIVFYIFALFFVTVPSFIDGLSEELSNAAIGLSMIEMLNDILIYGLLILIFLNVSKLVQYMGADDFHESVLMYSKKTYIISIILLITILFMQVINNLYQVVFISSLTDVSANIYIPLDALLISITFFFLGKYLTKVNDLNEEHNLIV